MISTFSQIQYPDNISEIDREQLETPLPPIPPICDHGHCGGCWRGYPQARFPNWTYRQVGKSKIYKAIVDYSRDLECICHRVNVVKDGFFTNPGSLVARVDNEEETWRAMIHEEVRNMISLIKRN
jgi:hypothetical protein